MFISKRIKLPFNLSFSFVFIKEDSDYLPRFKVVNKQFPKKHQVREHYLKLRGFRYWRGNNYLHLILRIER